MTLLAGAYRRRGPLERPEELVRALSDSISRNSADHREIVRDDRAFMIKVDVGAFTARAQMDDGTAATFVAGEPLIGTHLEAARDRATDTQAIHRALGERRHDALADARGIFSAAHYHRGTKRLTLATDKLGIRAVYLWTDGDTVVFSSTLRVLESCALLKKQIDVRGLAERLAFGYPLATRTTYSNITMLGPSQVIELDGSGTLVSEYWRSQDIARSARDLDALSTSAFDVFMDSVRVRLGGDRTTTSFLSGGLDSRVVTGALRAENVDVHTFNFAKPNTQDRVFGAQFAAKAGTTHEEHDANFTKSPAWIFTLAGLCERSAAPIRARVERPHVVWSGDGGSVGLGHVHLGPTIIERSNAGDVTGMVEAYLRAEHVTVPTRLLGADVVTEMEDAPRRGVLAEIERLGSYEPAQALYLFLMQNDQRRGLQLHFETIDEHRVETLLPLLDSEFLAVIASVPVEMRSYHTFYVKWLENFPAYVLNTPWQAYPGHVPSPVSATETLAGQWDPASAAANRTKLRRNQVRRARKTLMSRPFASRLMKRHVLAIATILHSTGLRSYGHILNAAAQIQRLWSLSDGIGDRSS
jgi:hypothetical protein